MYAGPTLSTGRRNRHGRARAALWWVLASGALGGLCAGLLVRRVVVEGHSMSPALEPGDRLVVVRTGAWLALHRGQIVAVRDPRRPARVLVKRVAAWRDGRVVLEGDNAPASTDSRHFGPVHPSAVVGVVCYRYAPSDRAGRLRLAPSGRPRR